MKIAPGQTPWFVPANDRSRASRQAWVSFFPPRGINGVYVIASRDSCDGSGRCRVLYVGESHTGRLRKTLARHFQDWKDKTQQRFTYNRFSVVISWMKTTADDAKDVEYDWRAALEPRDNPLGAFELPAVVGADLEDQEIPF